MHLFLKFTEFEIYIMVWCSKNKIYMVWCSRSNMYYDPFVWCRKKYYKPFTLIDVIGYILYFMQIALLISFICFMYHFNEACIILIYILTILFQEWFIRIKQFFLVFLLYIKYWLSTIKIYFKILPELFYSKLLHLLDFISNYILFSMENFYLFNLEILFPEIIFLFNICLLLFLKPKNKALKYNYYNEYFEALWYYSILSLIVYIFLKSIQVIKFKNLNLQFYFFNYFLFENIYTMLLKITLIFLILICLCFIFHFFILQDSNVIKIRFLFFLLISVIFLFILIMSLDLFTIYLAIEGLTLILSVLLCYNLTRSSVESSLKYLILSSFTSCLLILSISFFICFFGSTNLLFLKILSNIYLFKFLNNSIFLHVGFLFLKYLNYLFFFFLLNILFKLAAWPCCFWVPDIYSGSSIPVIFYFSTVIKFIFFFFFFKFSYFFFSSYFFFFKFFFLIIAVSSSIFGSFGSLFQNKLKIFIAFSGISHIGLIFFALSTMNNLGLFSAIFYLIFYTASSFLFFGLLLNTQLIFYSKSWGLQYSSILYISDLKGIFFKEKILGSYFIFLFLFFSGVPPFISFFGKFWIYTSLFLEKNYFIIIFLFFISFISVFYYLWWIRFFLFETSLDSYSRSNYYSIFTLKYKTIFCNKYLINSQSLFLILHYITVLQQVLFILIIVGPFYIFLNPNILYSFIYYIFLIIHLLKW